MKKGEIVMFEWTTEHELRHPMSKREWECQRKLALQRVGERTEAPPSVVETVKMLVDEIDALRLKRPTTGELLPMKAKSGK